MPPKVKQLLAKMRERREMLDFWLVFGHPHSDAPRVYYTLIDNHADRWCSMWEWSVTLVDA